MLWWTPTAVVVANGRLATRHLRPRPNQRHPDRQSPAQRLPPIRIADTRFISFPVLSSGRRRPRSKRTVHIELPIPKSDCRRPSERWWLIAFGDAFGGVGVVESSFGGNGFGFVVGAGVSAFGHHHAAIAGGARRRWFAGPQGGGGFAQLSGTDACCPDRWCRCARSVRSTRWSRRAVVGPASPSRRSRTFSASGENGTDTSGSTDASGRPGRGRCGRSRRPGRVCRSRGTGTSDPGSGRNRPSTATGCSAVRVASPPGWRTSRIRARSRIAAQQRGRQHPAAEHERRRRRALRRLGDGRGADRRCRRCGGGVDGFLVGDDVDHRVLGGRSPVARCHSRIDRIGRPVRCG